MGWDGYRLAGRKPDVSLISSFYERDNDELSIKVLDGSIVKLTVFYAAAEVINKKTGESFVSPIVSRIQIKKDDMIYIKDIGPDRWYLDCPERILDLITDKRAESWVNDCRARLIERSIFPKVGAGARILFNNPVKFGVFDVTELLVKRSAGGRYTCECDLNPYVDFVYKRSLLEEAMRKGNIKKIVEAPVQSKRKP